MEKLTTWITTCFPDVIRPRDATETTRRSFVRRDDDDDERVRWGFYRRPFVGLVGSSVRPRGVENLDWIALN